MRITPTSRTAAGAGRLTTAGPTLAGGCPALASGPAEHVTQLGGFARLGGGACAVNPRPGLVVFGGGGIDDY